ncbi:MAG: hypothetical protein H3C31_02830 [Brumimicrobium sp.]|nr:hypothetical protein [Brumimicrobium sp.]MCO5268551.1 hypothetical protein [Brumimicrobium sp.]
MLERIRFMKVNKNKRFEYTPRYYDERKERIEHLKKLYDEDSSDTQVKRDELRSQMQQAWRGKTYEKQKNAANIRLIVILAVILVIVYYIFGYVDTFSAEVTNIDTP